MKTIVLRFSDSFAPKDGTLAEHLKMIKENGFVWWGKRGPRISQKVIKDTITDGNGKVLLVRGGTKEKYWATVTEISDGCPQRSMVPEYYRDEITFYGSFLRIVKIERAEENVLEHLFVRTTGAKMSDIINKAMASYFIVEEK